MQLGYNATRFVKSQAKKVIDTKVKGDFSRANYSEISKIILFFISTVDEFGQSQMMVILVHLKDNEYEICKHAKIDRL